MVFRARERSERQPSCVAGFSSPVRGQRDAGPSINVRWIYSFSGTRERSERQPSCVAGFSYPRGGAGNY